MADDILYDIRGTTAIITINRPEHRNAISIGVRTGLFDAFRRFDADPALRVAILTGAGDRAFCAGMDLKEAAEQQHKVPPPIPVLGDNIKVSKPVIAAVNGFAYAGGFLLAQMCDLCVASDNAKFAITEGKVGRGMWWAPPLVHIVGSRVAMELLLTGQSIDAKRAHEIGFVNRVAPLAELLPTALALANEIAECAPLTVAAAREVVNHSINMGCAAALEVGRQIFVPVYNSEDAQEGPRAFKEKRKPVWKGR